MQKQSVLRLVVPGNGGSASVALDFKTFKTPAAKILADLLKRQCRTVMGDITECQSNTLPAHLSRLMSLREIVAHLLRHDYRETTEACLSGVQLLHPCTLADYLACLEITRNSHRAPSFLNSRDADLAEINRKLDTIAGFLGGKLRDGACSDTDVLDVATVLRQEVDAPSLGDFVNRARSLVVDGGGL